jgi:hypothetical protein
VHGASADATGSFELSVVKRPVIDSCQGAVARLDPLRGGQYSNVDNTTLSTVQGTLVGASLDTAVLPTCGVSAVTTPGVWYTVFGTGGRMLAFFNEFGETDFLDARVSVFRGSCSSLECVEQDDSLRWNSIAGELYSIFVHGGDGSSGNFGLFIDAGNEFCTDVVNPLSTDNTFAIGTTVNGANASTIDGLPLCPLSVDHGGAVAWFSVVGTGETLRASTYELPNNIDFTLYSGSCGNLTCVEEVDIGFNPYDGYGGFNQDFLFNVTASWNSTAGELYYLLLQGDGAYSIKVEGASAFKPTVTP